MHRGTPVAQSDAMKNRRRAAWLVVVLGISACSKDGGGAAGPNAGNGDGGVGGATQAVTFHKDVRPLIETHCGGCHRDGGIAPFALGYDPSEWKNGAPGWAGQAVAAVEARTMPPWMPDPSCGDFAGSRRLADDELAVFTAWRDAAFAEGDAKDYEAPVAAPGAELGAPTLMLAPAEAYTPNASLDDDYRCFLLPHTFDEQSYLTATQVEPDATSEVHHVILFAVDEGGWSNAQQLEAKDPEPGYACFGGSGVTGAANVGGWVPGMVPQVAPVDTARVLKQGSHLIMQVHYNLSQVHETGAPEADRTSAKLWLMKSGEQPKYKLTTVPLANLGIEIPAGAAESIQVKGFNVPFGGTLTGVLPHMHTRGTRIEVKHQRAGKDTCLVRIPEWDFHWQQGYRFTESTYLELQKGDALELTCVYDNSQGTEAVRWGEGTADEMCLNYLEIRTELTGATLATQCPSYEGCVAGCAQGDAACLLKCGTVTPSCQSCVPAALGRCSAGTCPNQATAVQSCVQDCQNDRACLAKNCAAAYASFITCLEPSIRDGSCDGQLETCGT